MNTTVSSTGNQRTPKKKNLRPVYLTVTVKELIVSPDMTRSEVEKFLVDLFAGAAGLPGGFEGIKFQYPDSEG